MSSRNHWCTSIRFSSNYAWNFDEMHFHKNGLIVVKNRNTFLKETFRLTSSFMTWMMKLIYIFLKEFIFITCVNTKSFVGLNCFSRMLLVILDWQHEEIKFHRNDLMVVVMMNTFLKEMYNDFIFLPNLAVLLLHWWEKS